MSNLTFCRIGSFYATCSSFAAMLLLSSHAGAADWKITPTLEVKETYTDNVRLAPSGQEESEFITQLSPGISLSGTGSHLTVNVRYALQNLLYANDSNRNNISHQLSAFANAELLDDLFFVDTRASISQQNISAFGPLPTDNTNTTGNRTDVITYSISPYLRHHFKNFASAESRYTHDAVTTGASGSADSQADRLQFDLTSGSDFRQLGWGLHYSKERIDYSSNTTPSADLESYSGDLRYLVTPQFSLTATGGYEHNDYGKTLGNSSGPFWTAGFAWNPSRRTSIAANTGERYFGNTYALSASHRTRRTAWSLSYSEDITTTRSQFLIPVTIDTAAFLDQLFAAIIPDPLLRQVVVEVFIRENGLPSSLAESVNFFSNRFFLQKRWQASTAVTGARNTVVLSLSEMTREAQTAQSSDSLLLGSLDLSLNDNVKQTGVNALWNWAISPRTNANFSASFTRTTSATTNRQDDGRLFRASLTRKLQPKVNGTIELRRNELVSNQADADYVENAISATINMSF